MAGDSPPLSISPIYLLFHRNPRLPQIMKQPLEKWLYDGMDAIANSVCLRAFMMALLTLILMIPIQMIDGVIRQRQATRSEAQNDVTSSWGGATTSQGALDLHPLHSPLAGNLSARWPNRNTESRRKKMGHLLTRVTAHQW